MGHKTGVGFQRHFFVPITNFWHQAVENKALQLYGNTLNAADLLTSLYMKTKTENQSQLLILISF